MADKTESNPLGAGPPKGNKNAEKYNYEKAEEILSEAVVISLKQEFDFIGEVAQEIGSTYQKLSELTKKYPDLKPLYDEMKSNCEVNCFRNGKKGNINTGMAIMNLKSNHGWTDRIDSTSKGQEIKSSITNINMGEMSDAFLKELAKKSNNWK